MIVKFFIKAKNGLQIYFPFYEKNKGWFKLIDFHWYYGNYSSTQKGLGLHFELCHWRKEGSAINYWWIFKKNIPIPNEGEK